MNEAKSNRDIKIETEWNGFLYLAEFIPHFEIQNNDYVVGAKAYALTSLQARIQS